MRTTLEQELSNWKDIKIGEILTLEYGKGLKQYQDNIGNYEVFGTNGKIGKTDTYLYDKPSLVIGRKGAYRGVHLAKKPFFVIDTAFYTKSRIDDLDIIYLYYWFKCIDINSMDSGSAIPSTSRDEVYDLDISLPSIPEQKAIAAVLSSLDDKIDLLHRQNLTLETMAETLFRQWFIEKAQEEWEIKPIGNYVQIKRGGSPRPIQDFLSDTGYRWLKISDVSNIDSPFIFEIKEHIKEHGINKTVHLEAGALVLSNSATPGIPKILTIDSCIHDGWLYFPKSYFSNEFLYLLFKYLKPQFLSHGNGSIFTNLKTDIIKEFKIHIPDELSLKEFQNIAQPLFGKLYSNSKQIRTLEKFRDSLLPKLMSGEVRIAV